MGMNLPSDNFYPPEGAISAYLVSRAALICCCLAVGNRRRESDSPLLLLKVNVPHLHFFRFMVFLWWLQFRTIKQTNRRTYFFQTGISAPFFFLLVFFPPKTFPPSRCYFIHCCEISCLFNSPRPQSQT